MVIICFAFVIVIIFVYLPYDLRKKLRIFSLERTVYKRVTTSDFGNKVLFKRKGS